MDERKRAEIEQACARLATAFHVYIDAFRHDELLDLFAEDALWVHPMMGTLRGRAEMKRYLDDKSRKPTAMHMTTNILIDVVDESHAKGTAYYAFYYDGEGRMPGPLKGPMAVGRYVDEYVRTPAGWRFSYREPRNFFTADGFENLILLKSDEA